MPTNPTVQPNDADREAARSAVEHAAQDMQTDVPEDDPLWLAEHFARHRLQAEARIKELEEENARLREAAWPEYDTDIPDALDAYSKECSDVIGRFGITEKMSATFRWHEAWDRVRKAISARSFSPKENPDAK